MAHVTHAFRPLAAPAGRRGLPALLARFRRWLSDFRAARRQARALAELGRRIGDDDHLLRDIGFARSGGRIVLIDPDRRPFG